MHRLAAIVLIIVSMAALNAVPAYCEDMDTVQREDAGEYIETKTLDGTVTSISADGDVITFRPFDAVDISNDEITVGLLPGAQVYRGGDSISSSDIQIGDVVTVEYKDDPSGLRAQTITVQ
jgi:hypothetical protein